MRITDSSRSVGQPAPRVPDVEPRSVEQPADQDITLTTATPLWDNLIGELEPAVQNHPSGEAFMDCMATRCFVGKLLTSDVYGEPIKTPVPLSLKMEERASASRTKATRFEPAKAKAQRPAAKLAERHAYGPCP